MSEKRGLFQSIFGKKESKNDNIYSEYKLLNSWQSRFSAISGNAWEINAVRAAVDAFARSAGKIQPKHIRRGDTVTVVETSGLNRLLQTKPNKYMSAYAFYYRVACQYMINNNAYIYPVVDNFSGRITAFYPINANTVELLEYDGDMYYGFCFAGGKRYIAHHSDIIHLRRHYNENDMFGSDNKPLLPVLRTANTFNQSMSKFAELVALVRGILRVNGTAKTKDLNARRDDFIRDNLKMDNNGSGVIVTDSMYDYVPIDQKTTPIPNGQLEYIRKEIYDYFGTNENIVQNKATPEEWTAYYEGQLSPFFVQLSQELTNCIFTEKELGFGNGISLESNRLQYAGLKDKVAAGKFLTDIGAATLDQILEMFNMPPIGGEDGKRRTQTLNVVNAELADKYQVGTPTQEKENDNANQE